MGKRVVLLLAAVLSVALLIPAVASAGNGSTEAYVGANAGASCYSRAGITLLQMGVHQYQYRAYGSARASASMYSIGSRAHLYSDGSWVGAGAWRYASNTTSVSSNNYDAWIPRLARPSCRNYGYYKRYSSTTPLSGVYHTYYY